MKTLIKWLLWVSATIMLIVAVVLFNPNLLKSSIESYLGDLTGRSVNLDGDLAIDLGRVTVIAVKDAKVYATTLPDQPALLGLEQLKLSLVTASLFEDTVILESLQLTGLKLQLETDPHGTGNWQNPAHTPSQPKEQKPPGKKLFIGDIRITESDIKYHNGVRDVDHLLHIGAFGVQRSPDGTLIASLDGLFNGRLLALSGAFGPYENMLAGRDIRFDAKGNFGDLTINGHGLIDSLTSPERPEFNIVMKGADIDEITAMLEIDDLGGGSFSLNATGEVTQDRYKTDIKGKIGDVELDLVAWASNLSELDDLDLELAAFGPRLGAVTRAFGIKHWPDKPFSIKADVRRMGRSLDVSDLSLGVGETNVKLDAVLSDFPHLNDSRVTLSVSGDDVSQFHELLGISGPGIGAFELNGKLDVSAEGTEVVQVDLETSMGNADLSGYLGAAPTYTGSKFKLRVDGKSVRDLLSAYGLNGFPDHPFSFAVNAELIDNALRIEHGELGTAKEARLELDGLLTFEPGLENSNFNIRSSGQDLKQVLQGFPFSTEIPAKPYHLNSSISILEEGIKLAETEASFDGMTLKTNGLVSLKDGLLGSDLVFDVRHESISALSDFELIGNSLDTLRPGQAFRGSGKLTVENDGWKFSGVNARLGTTDIELDALINPVQRHAGTRVDFSVKGADTHQFFAEKIASRLAEGAFDVSGRLALNDTSLLIESLEVNTTRSHAKLDLKLGWPISETPELVFDIDMLGEDASQLLPALQAFQWAPSAFKLKTAGSIKQNQVRLDGFDATVGDLKVGMTGEIDEDGTSTEANIRFSAVSNDISTLGQINGKPLPSIPLNISSNVIGNAKNFAFSNLAVSLGDNDVNANLDVSLSGPRPKIKLLARSKLIDIAMFQATEEAGETKDRQDRDKERLIPAWKLPLSLLEKADMDITLAVDELKLEKDSLKDLSIDTQVNAGAMQLRELSFNAPEGTLRSSLSIQPTGDNNADVKLDISTSNLLLNLSGLPPDEFANVPHLDIELHVSGSGSNLQEITSTSNGYQSLKSTGGLLEDVNLSILDTFILDEVFSLIMPKSGGTRNTQLTCAAAFLNIENGLVTTEPALAFTTDKIAVVSRGTLDLKTEKLHFNFNATPNKALKVSAGELFNSFILIKGTLAKPAVGLDPGKTLIQGGAAVGTAGLTLLAKGLMDRVGNTKPLCEEMLKTSYEPGKSN